MKKVVRMAVMAVAVVGLMTACKQKPAEQVVDSVMEPEIEALAEMTDTLETVVEEAEEVVKTVASKATTKKEEPTQSEKLANAAGGRASKTTGTMTLNKADGTKGTVSTDVDPANAKPQTTKTQELGNVGRAAKK